MGLSQFFSFSYSSLDVGNMMIENVLCSRREMMMLVPAAAAVNHFTNIK